MSVRRIVALAAAGTFALGCTEGPDAATSPEVRLSHNAGNACQASSSKEVKAQQSAMLAGANLRQAQTLWRAVESACSPTNADAANGALMTYLNYLRGIYPAGFIQLGPNGQEANLLGHINTVFQHVAYTAPNLPSGPNGPLQGGALGVLPASGSPNELARGGFGAVTILQGDGLGHLVVMYPTNASCLSVGNLNKIGTCVEVSAFPTLSPTALPAVKVKVGLCFPDGPLGGAPGLGHETGGKTEVAGQLAYPADCHPALAAGSWSDGFGGAMKRLAFLGKRAFGISNAYASHAGLGGIGEAMSPWGGLDLLAFNGSFDNDAIGAPPNTGGTFGFDMDVTAPGTILVQSSLGEYTGPLVVLNQAGGACNNCGQLLLRAKLASATPGSVADEGVYDVSWISLQTAPGVKEAPFVIADSAGRVIGKLSYITRQNSNHLYYNDTILVGAWERNKPQSFKVRIDLDNGWTTLFIGPYNGTLGSTAATAVPFHDVTASNLASIAADFRGIDSGTMGWDQIGVQRIPDQQP